MSDLKYPVYAVGIMSGTSADGIDGAAVEISKNRRLEIHSTTSLDYPADIKSKIRKISARKITDAKQSEGLDIQLAGLYAETANRLMDKIRPAETFVIGCHGQTVHHNPNGETPFSIQLGDGEEIAKLTDHTVVTDFRSADIEMGGQGAPLVPAFHKAVFSDKSHSRAIINIGGIANITLLPKHDDDVTGFDIGPGNTFIDGWCRSQFKREFDDRGNIARGGQLQLDLLDILLKDPYFAAPPPKSTGLEYFNDRWLKEKINSWEGRYSAGDEDVLATLTALTAKCITDQVNALSPPVDAVYICGGGVHNILLMDMIKERLSASVDDTSVLGIAPRWVEAAAFAWMAFRTVNGLPSTLPSVTGASRPVVAGRIFKAPD